MLVSDAIERSASRDPDRVACVAGQVRVTYAELWAEVQAAALLFARIGQAGDGVAVIGGSSVSFIVAYCAIPLAGRVCTFINHRLQRNEVLGLLAESGVVAVFADREFADVFVGFPDDVQVLWFGGGKPPPWSSGIIAAPGQGITRRPQPDDVAWVLYTSGTTGQPKAVELSHRNVAAGMVNSILGYRFERDDVLVFPFPLDHVSAVTPLQLFMVGAKVVLPDRFAPDHLLRLLAEHGGTITTLAPTMLVKVLDYLEAEPVKLPRLRLVMYGAAAMTAAVLARATSVFGPILTQGYGMTEAATNIAVLAPAEHAALLRARGTIGTAVGRPLPLIEIRVIDEDGAAVPRGAVGEVSLRGEQVCDRYRGVDVAVSHPGGWFHTGDVGLVDDEGFLHVVGRRKDVINTGGEKVYPPEIEEVLLRHPAVREAAVLGMPDPLWGERVCAFVVFNEGAPVVDAELANHCARYLSPFKRPKQIERVCDLPRTSTGKIRKQALADLVTERIAAFVRGDEHGS
jgi:acyl-CoA synthetase (AMP-forming)/AMP-acid ligase II